MKAVIFGPLLSLPSLPLNGLAFRAPDKCVLWILLLSPSNFWVPIFEGSTVLKNESSDFWPIAVLNSGVHLTEPNIRYLNCKGSAFPLPSKNLAPLTEGLCLPLCNKEATKTKDENELLLADIMLSANQLTYEDICADREALDKLAKKH